MSKIKIYLFLYWLLFWAYAVFSYTQTAPNLVLTSWQPYWDFQQYMWKLGQDSQLVTYVYTLLIVLFFLLYSLIVSKLYELNISITTTVKYLKRNKLVSSGMLTLFLLPLFLSYNALSFDVFNYIFNARMVYLYQADPHVKTALDFHQDLWTRFMHNTHTPAPYGYGWTVLSLIPYGLGMGYFTLTWFIFRGFAVLSILLFAWLAYIYAQKYSLSASVSQFALVVLNPLVLIEVISNQHNDFWMLIPAIASFVALKLKYSFRVRGSISLLLLVISISTKFATAALIPIWLLMVFIEFESEKLTEYIQKRFKVPKLVIGMILPFIKNKILQFVPIFSSIILFLPLILPRSKQFLPWYLIWSLGWLVLTKNKTWSTFILIMSFFAMLRYVPWLWFAGYQDPVSEYQLLITWLPGLVYVVYAVYSKKRSLTVRSLRVGNW